MIGQRREFGARDEADSIGEDVLLAQRATQQCSARTAHRSAALGEHSLPHHCAWLDVRERVFAGLARRIGSKTRSLCALVVPMTDAAVPAIAHACTSVHVATLTVSKLAFALGEALRLMLLYHIVGDLRLRVLQQDARVVEEPSPLQVGHGGHGARQGGVLYEGVVAVGEGLQAQDLTEGCKRAPELPLAKLHAFWHADPEDRGGIAGV
mmetsp:Transcript_13354/g.55926  ORF Transcript_13354/g.55926 Transcript_13354/m.55926 type:complete len:209 (-) Transcript_13354:638-1264(-)